MPFKNGKFIPAGKVAHKPGATAPTIASRPHGTPAEKDKHPHAESQSPHGGNQEKHVKETHPGKTQPHPETGVHAVHTHHTGEHHAGGPAYTTHAHHDDGTVETRENRSQDEMEQDQHEAFPMTASAENDMEDNAGGGEDFAETLGGGIGGTAA